MAIAQRQSSWFARISPKITLPKDVDLQLGVQFDAALKEAFTLRHNILEADVSVNKELFKGRGAINFNVSDLFNSRVHRRQASNASFLSNSEHQYHKCQINQTFTYRFKNAIENRGDDGEDGDDGDDSYQEDHGESSPINR